METGSNPETLKRGEGVSVRGGTGKRHGANGAKVDPFVPKTDHNPRELRSWAKRTGFVSDYSGEAGTSGSAKFESFGRKREGSSPNRELEADPVLGRTRHNRGNEIHRASHGGAVRNENVSVLEGGTVGSERKENENGSVLGLNHDGERKVGLRGNENGSGHGISAVAPVMEEKDEVENVVHGEVKVNVYPDGVEPPVDGGWQGPSELKCGLEENPGFG